MLEYWDHNQDLAADLQRYWQDSGPSTMDKVFPLRIYGDGADTIGLNAFEILTMISVAPKHSSTWKTRFVFPGYHILLFYFFLFCLNMMSIFVPWEGLQL